MFQITVRASFAVVLFCTVVRGVPIGSGVFNPANGHTYFLLDKSAWTVAETEAVALGGHLASVNNAAENQFLLDAFCSGADSKRVLWIGLTDQGNEGHFHWTSGEPLTYTNWFMGEPNNHATGGGAENFVSFNWNFALPEATASTPRGTWNDDIDLGHQEPLKPTAPAPFNGVAELVPEPGHLLLLTSAMLLLLPARRGRVNSN
jgi:hypothetical protein